MKAKEIINSIMGETSTTQELLAKTLGYKTQSAISSKLKATKLDVEFFSNVIEAMGYSVIVVSNDGKHQYIVGEDENAETPPFKTVSDDRKVLETVHSINVLQR